MWTPPTAEMPSARWDLAAETAVSADPADLTETVGASFATSPSAMFLVWFFSFLLRTLTVATPAIAVPTTAKTRAMTATSIAGDGRPILIGLIPISSSPSLDCFARRGYSTGSGSRNRGRRGLRMNDALDEKH